MKKTGEKPVRAAARVGRTVRFWYRGQHRVGRGLHRANAAACMPHRAVVGRTS